MSRLKVLKRTITDTRSLLNVLRLMDHAVDEVYVNRLELPSRLFKRIWGEASNVVFTPQDYYNPTPIPTRLTIRDRDGYRDAISVIGWIIVSEL